jgi:hypothetical protein
LLETTATVWNAGVSESAILAATRRHAVQGLSRITRFDQRFPWGGCRAAAPREVAVPWDRSSGCHRTPLAAEIYGLQVWRHEAVDRDAARLVVCPAAFGMCRQ